MIPSEIYSAVFEANQSLITNRLVTHTWGNVSGIDRRRDQIVIKPSGIPYSEMRINDLVCVDLTSGKKVAGDKQPSSDLLTHLEIYREFPEIGGIAHAHSMYAVAWAQAEREIPCMGTTHADHFFGEIPLTRCLTPAEVSANYERNTGLVITELFRDRNLKPLEVPGVLVSKHGPFCWGKDAVSAAANAHVLEVVAKMAYLSCSLNNFAGDLPSHILEKHYQRKHGVNAYYGQVNDRSASQHANIKNVATEAVSNDR